MIKAAAREQLPVVHPENPGIAGVTIAQISGAPSSAGCGSQEHRGGLDGHTRLVAAVLVDGRARPIALRHGHVRQDGGAARQGTARTEPGFRSRGDSGDDVHGPADRGDARRPVSGSGADAIAARRGSPASRSMWSIPTIRFPTGSRWGISGAEESGRQTRMSFTTSPEMPVSRTSRPWNFTASRL